MDTIKIANKKNTRIIAHRGLSGIEKENSMPAFVAAGNRSYFGIETDIHVTADGKFIVIHDDNTLRVTGLDAKVEETAFDELRQIYLLDTDGAEGRTDLRLPELTEYIRVCKRYGKKAVLELKNPMTKENIAEIFDVIIGLEYFSELIIISFCFENLVIVRELYPEQSVQFLTKRYEEGLIDRLKEHKFDLDIDHRQVDEQLVENCHKNGIALNCWTVNDPERAQELIDMGIDFITTNILE